MDGEHTMIRQLRVVRGGCWYDVAQVYLHVPGQSSYGPSYWSIDFGFRCVRGVAQKRRVIRGGSWVNDHQDSLRASGRSRDFPSDRVISFGFRCVRGKEDAEGD